MPSLFRIVRGDPRYPASLIRGLGDEAPAAITALGDPALLGRRKLGMFCSVRCPGSVIVGSYDLAQRLRMRDMAVMGGFHSPMEREWLSVLLRGPAPVILCPARRITGSRLPLEYRRPLDEGRLLILSCFDEGERRATAELAVDRNRFVAALADDIFVGHAEPGGKTEAFCVEMLGRGKPLYTLDDPSNGKLIAMGARSVGEIC
jgi:predicted Rossmann fold nucleotide-binding protein DprA/Smf involved in DNA uptake